MSHKQTETFKEYIMDNYEIPGLSGEEEYQAIMECLKDKNVYPEEVDVAWLPKPVYKHENMNKSDFSSYYNMAEDGIKKPMIEKSDWD